MADADVNSRVSTNSPADAKPRLLRRLVLTVLAFLLVPYLGSRIASNFRQVRVVSVPAVEDLRQAASNGRLKVLTYNIAHGRGLAESNWDGGDADQRIDRLQEIASVLKKANADVVILNEVDFDCSWSNGVNQAEFLATEAGYSYRAEQRNLDFRILLWRWKFGNAVLSRYPLTNAQVVDVPGYSAIETLLAGQKRALRVDVKLGGNDVCVIAAHLCHRSETIRAESAEALLGVARSFGGNTIIAGDLNSSPPEFRKTADSDVNAISTLDDSNMFQRRPVQPPTSLEQFTFRFGEVQTVIDWILIPRTATYLDYQVIDTDLSDHRPVAAEIRF